jgi:hypothetical protein
MTLSAADAATHATKNPFYILISVAPARPDTPYTGQSGTITQGGILNGTTVVVYDPAFVITPNPNVVAYIAELIIATRQGQLKTSNVYLYDNAKMNL